MIKIWEVDPSLEIATMKGHNAPITALCFMPGNSDTLASASQDKTVKMWNLETYTQVATICRMVTSFVMLPGGEMASGSYEKAISVWGGKGMQQEVKKLLGHADWVLSLAVLPEGNLASGSKDKSIIVWDVQEGREVFTLKGHSGWVTALAMLPSGCLASSSVDTTIKVWDLQQQKEIVTLRGHGLGVTAFAVMHSGWIAMGSRDKVIRVWTHTQSSERLKPKPRGAAMLAHANSKGIDIRSQSARSGSRGYGSARAAGLLALGGTSPVDDLRPRTR